MRSFTIIPNKSVGLIVFGLERDVIRQGLSGFKREFKKSKFSKNTTDDFGDLHVFYNMNNECNAVEVFRDAEIIYNGESLFELNIDKLKTLFPDIQEEYGCLISKQASIGITVENGKAESILVGNQGYYL